MSGGRRHQAVAVQAMQLASTSEAASEPAQQSTRQAESAPTEDNTRWPSTASELASATMAASEIAVTLQSASEPAMATSKAEPLRNLSPPGAYQSPPPSPAWHRRFSTTLFASFAHRRTSHRGHRRGDSRASNVVVDGVSLHSLQQKYRWLPQFAFRLPLCCPTFRLPAWRFSSKLEWRSQTDFEDRFVVVAPSAAEEHRQPRRKFKTEKSSLVWPWQNVFNLKHSQTGSGDTLPSATPSGSLLPTTAEETRRLVAEAAQVDRSKTETHFDKNRTHTSKYTVLTFVPYNLFEQFRRGANIYFLSTLLLTLMLKDSPISPTTWLMSLMFVVVVTMVKQGYEDFLRHQSDREINERSVRVIRHGRLVELQSRQVEVGDVVHLQEDDVVPCDAVVLATSHNHGQCYVMTANLDGETSLKTRSAATITKGLSKSKISSFVGHIICENPNPKLDNYLGRMTAVDPATLAPKEECSLGVENLLLAGIQIKNTKEVLAACVYAGTQTKMSLNSKITRIKFSTIEKSLNKYLLFYLLVLLAEMIVSSALSMLIGVEYLNEDEIDDYSFDVRQSGSQTFVYPKSNIVDHWYIGEFVARSLNSAVYIFLIWLVLYNYVIPISMYVSIEVQKFLASMFFGWDVQMYDSDRDIPARCNCSDINEELGLVTHLFTDKTGTLTRNEMDFKKYSRNGKIFDRRQFADEEWSNFLMVMALCHSVEVTDDHKLAASSPDEKALLEVCKESGFIFLGTSPSGEVRVRAKQDTLTFHKLAELEFDSFRKCMSVIVRDETGTLHVLSKGAESAMLPVCTGSDFVEETERIVDAFATDGLRTLVFAHKIITDSEYQHFSESLELAKRSIVNRAKFVRDVYKDLEADFELVGATGIEDRLQDEVVETIEVIRNAGIITWMLTGDKKETALNLAHAAGLVPSLSKIIDLCEVVDRDVSFLINQVSEEMRERTYSRSVALIVDGKSIATIMKSSGGVETEVAAVPVDDGLREKFRSIAAQCHSVIACRLSPIQKSQLVRLVKESQDEGFVLTAAIGDGGNDISMIQEAHVGIGIVGHEGTAAAQSADFAFSQFRYLRRALLVHGTWYYRRLAFVVQYSFYKNVACFTCQLMFAGFSNFSGQTLYDSLFLFLFNTLYASVPVMVYGLSEQFLQQETLLQQPSLYRLQRGNSLMSVKQLLKWFCLGLWHAAVCFFGWLLIWPVSRPSDDLFGFGAIVACTSVLVVNAKILLEARYWSWPLVLSVLVSVVSYVVITLLEQLFLVESSLLDNSDQFRTYMHVIYLPATWFGTLLLVIVALLPDMLLQLWDRMHISSIAAVSAVAAESYGKTASPLFI